MQQAQKGEVFTSIFNFSFCLKEYKYMCVICSQTQVFSFTQSNFVLFLPTFPCTDMRKKTLGFFLLFFPKPFLQLKTRPSEYSVQKWIGLDFGTEMRCTRLHTEKQIITELLSREHFCNFSPGISDEKSKNLEEASCIEVLL